MSFKKILIIVCCLFVALPAAAAQGARGVKRVAYFGDSIVFSDTYLFTGMLQLLFDKEFGENKVIVDNYSFFDMNTAQVGELFTNEALRPSLAVILSGEANYLNLTGFYEYHKAAARNATADVLPRHTNKEAVLKLNRAVAAAYGVDEHGKTHEDSVLSAVFKAAFGLSKKGKFTPSVMPDFNILNNPYYLDGVNLMSRVYYYNDAWECIRKGDFAGAVKILSAFTGTGATMDPYSYYMLGIIVLNAGSADAETALRYFMSGILLDPFNPNNACYKGLAAVYMSFKGEISAEALFFARLLKNGTLNLIPEINAMTAINVIDHAQKINAINNWIAGDFQNIRRLAARSGIPVLFLDYPKDVLANMPIKEFAQSSGVPFADNSAFLNMETSPVNSWYMAVARNVAEKIKEKNLLKLRE